MPSQPQSRSNLGGCVLAILALGCHRPSASVVEHGLTSHVPLDGNACGSLNQAIASAAEGRLRSAERLLNRCSGSFEASRLLAMIKVALGDVSVDQGELKALGEVAKFGIDIADFRRRQRLRRTETRDPTELDALEQSRSLLVSGACSKAKELAEASYWRFRPNPEAAMLVGRAERCQSQTIEANRWFARSSWELEQVQPLRWAVESSSTRIQWTGRHRFQLGGFFDEPEAAIASEFPILDWRYGMYRKSHPTHSSGSLLTFNDHVHIYTDLQRGIYALDRSSGDFVWRVDLSPSMDASLLETVVGAGDEYIVQVGRQVGEPGALWRRVDAQSGEASSWKAIPGLSLYFAPRCYSNPFVDWFIVESTSSGGYSTETAVVSISGRSKLWNDHRWIRGDFVGVWSNNEAVYATDEALVAIDVWTARKRIAAQIPPELGRVRRVTTSASERRYIEGQAGLAVVDCKGGVCASAAKILAAPLNRIADPVWSPDGKYVAGRIVSASDYVTVWDLDTQKVVLSLPLPTSSGAIAVSPDGSKIAVAATRQLLELELASGSLRAAQLPTDDRNAVRLSARVVRDRQALGYTSTGISSYGWLAWYADGRIEGVNAPAAVSFEHGVIAGGDWYAPKDESGHGRRLFRVQSNSSSPIDVTVHALSPDGGFAVTSVTERNGEGRVSVSRLLPNEPHLFPIVTLSCGAVATVRAIFEKSSKAVFVKTNGKWSELALPSGRANSPSDIAWIENAIELSTDGQFALTESGTIWGRGKQARVVTFVPSPRQVASKWEGVPKLALHDHLALFPVQSKILIWSALDGKWVGQLKPVPNALVFTQDLPGNEGSGLIESFGNAAAESLACVLRDRLYPWEICADRFDEQGLLLRSLGVTPLHER